MWKPLHHCRVRTSAKLVLNDVSISSGVFTFVFWEGGLVKKKDFGQSAKGSLCESSRSPPAKDMWAMPLWSSTRAKCCRFLWLLIQQVTSPRWCLLPRYLCPSARLLQRFQPRSLWKRCLAWIRWTFEALVRLERNRGDL